MLTSSVFSSLTGSDNVLSYINRVQKFPMLSLEEEEALAKSWYDNGIISDAHKLVTSHLRLVVKIASGFKNYGLPLFELIMEGNVGLMQAVKKFNPNLGFRLSTYAVWWIKASIKDYILKSWSFVKIGTTQAQRKLFFSLRKIKKRLAQYSNSFQNNHNTLSCEDAKLIADECSVSVQEVENMNKRLAHRDKSLNDPVFCYDGGNNIELQDTLVSNVPNQESVYLINEKKQVIDNIISQALERLNDRHRDIFIKRRLVEEPETLEELSKKYAISKERVRQIEVNAFNKIKAFIESKKEEFDY